MNKFNLSIYSGAFLTISQAMLFGTSVYEDALYRVEVFFFHKIY